MAAVERATTQEHPLSIRSAVLSGAQLLGRAGLENSKLDAEVLLRHVLEIEKEQFYMRGNAPISREQEAEFRELLLRRLRREPVAYITGHKEFWSLDFVVTPAVLIPRPETELLVEVALRYLKSLANGSPLKVLEIGVGSGAISVCLAKEYAAAQIVAVDVSAIALDVARVNARNHGVADRIRFLPGDLFAPVEPLQETFDLIVSNPPYIRSGELPRLAPEIYRWEPAVALDGGIDGLDAYRRIIEEGQKYLATGGYLVLEMGADMDPALADLFACSGCYRPASVYHDYAGKHRVIAAVKLLSSKAAPTGINRG
jgi:release factor glutamine methyltransferase